MRTLKESLLSKINESELSLGQDVIVKVRYLDNHKDEKPIRGKIEGIDTFSNIRKTKNIRPENIEELEDIVSNDTTLYKVNGIWYNIGDNYYEKVTITPTH